MNQIHEPELWVRYQIQKLTKSEKEREGEND